MPIKIESEEKLSDLVSNLVYIGDVDSLELLLDVMADEGVPVEYLIEDVLFQFEYCKKDVKRDIVRTLIMARAIIYGLQYVFKYFPKNKTLNGTVVIGTVRADLHSLGNSVVEKLLLSSGVSVVNVGVDVSSTGFIRQIKKCNADVVILSCNLYSSLKYLKESVALIRERFGSDITIIGGGHALNKRNYFVFGIDELCDDILNISVIYERVLRNLYRIRLIRILYGVRHLTEG